MVDRISRQQAQYEALSLIAQHDGNWSWYQLDRALDVRRFPDGYRLNRLLQELEAGGWITSRTVEGKPSRLSITAKGRDRLSAGR
jgi:DNA-binding PadR family transcriptional regulator